MTAKLADLARREDMLEAGRAKLQQQLNDLQEMSEEEAKRHLESTANLREQVWGVGMTSVMRGLLPSLPCSLSRLNSTRISSTARAR